MTVKPWRQVITPHDNVLHGTFQESEFAADLTKVVNGSAPPEYQDPSLFFERTFITEGMRLLLDSVVRRLSGRGGDPVVQLQTAFGGGKTHAMLAVYHLAQGRPSRELAGVPTILDDAGVVEMPVSHVAVLDGNALSASHPRKRGAATVNTLWGEIAWQLGGDEGYAMVAQSDRDGVSPGKEILADLFTRFSPSIVLMDETVAYIRQFEEDKTYAGGTFGSNMSFLQALTEAAGHVPTAMVLASLPESDLEVGGERGRQALKQIEHLFRRLEAIWKPISTEEGFEIVRRRLFARLTDEQARDDACLAYARLYTQDAKYPSHTRESGYLDRLKAAYPIHPELFDRLYEDWATLEHFQRTRGVLRLMAMVVHRLWSDGNSDGLITPGSIPMYDAQVRNEIIRYLPQGWEPVVERDVDGPQAATTKIDEKSESFGPLQAARRAARCVFLGSASASSGQKVRGINIENIRLGCVQPGQPEGKFQDALRRLTDRLHYLYASGERYWYDTQTNLRREAESRMDGFSIVEEIVPEIRRRLESNIKKGMFAGVHIFRDHQDIPDDDGLRFVVLSPVHHHLWKKENTLAVKAALDTLENRGAQPRINRNRLIFFAADESAVAALYNQTRWLLAWQSIINEKVELNLDQHRMKEASKNQKEAEARLMGAIQEAYKWMLTPIQERNLRGNLKTRWENTRVSLNNGNWMEAISDALIKQEIAYAQWSPFHLRETLESWYWREDQRDYPLEKLWGDFCRYHYLPRLVTYSVLVGTVREGIRSKEYFGYAEGKEEGRYSGLVFGKEGKVYFDESSVIVHPETAAKQLEEEQGQNGGDGNGGNGSDGGGNGGNGGGEDGGNGGKSDEKQEKEKSKRRFYGSVMIQPNSAALDFTKICEEVINHFTSQLGGKAKITVEVNAECKKGFDEATIRTVSENCKTLNFIEAEFEEE